MKNIIIILLSIFLAVSLYSQTYEVRPHLFHYKDTNVVLSKQPDFNTQSFRLGWHWAMAKKMTNALKMNFIHIEIDKGYPYYIDSSSLSKIADSAYMIMNSSIIGNHWARYSPSESISFQYEPNYQVSTDDPYIFNKRYNDTTKPIFGFSNIHGFIPSSSNDDNYNRLVIKDSLNNSVILSDNWPYNYLEHTRKLVNYDNKPYWVDHLNFENVYDTLWIKEYNGNEFYISINLRRLNSGDRLLTNDTLLMIRLPFENLPDSQNNRISGYIKFDSLPNPNYGDTIHLPNSRGIARTLRGAISDTFFITRNMLPKGNESERDITISAHFTCDGKIQFAGRNFGLKNFPDELQENTIDKLNIEVYKTNKSAELAIDYIRIETPTARDLFRSYWDSTLVKKLQSDLNVICDANGHWAAKGLKPYRWYLIDEPGLERSYVWGVHRYLNKLLGNICTHEVDVQINQYDYYMENSEKWIGFWKFDAMNSCPYIRSNPGGEGQDKWEYLGFKTSFLNYSDTLNAEYESYFNYLKPDTLRNLSDKDFYSEIKSKDATLAYIEKSIYTNYADTSKNNYLYDDNIKWCAQFQVLSEGNLSKVNDSSTVWHFKYTATRPYTGEEVKYGIFNNLLMGADGLVYDGEYSDVVNDFLNDRLDNNPNGISFDRFMTRIGHGQLYYDSLNLNNLSTDTFLNLDEIGSDFLNFQHDYTQIHTCIDSAIVCNNLRLPGDRLYMGRKSIRKEMKKMHDFIRMNETILTEMKLASWYGVGYHIFYNQHPRFGSDTVMKNYIKYDSVRTKKLYQPDLLNGNTIPTEYEDFSQSFFDIALHCLNNDTLMENQFVLGIQNRHIAPHVFWIDTVNNQKIQYLRFLASAEFEDSCQTGNRTWKFRDAYLTRLGSREITIPFNICNTEDPDRHLLIRVKELKSDDADTNKYWKQELMSRYIDTVISGTAELALKLLPGEGKFLSVEILKPDTSFGHLAYSNQSKLISYPIYNQQGQETDSVRFHIAYHKPDSSGKMTVYYQRSKPVRRNSSNSNILWESPINVSNGINASPIGFFSNWNCAYPSMVVRKDGTTPKAYIVFSCRDTMANTNDCGQCPDTCLRYYHPVCESVVSLANDGATLQTSTMIVRSTRGYYPENWLNADFSCPVISAGSQGNFYAWADSICGIGVGYKAPDQLILTNVSYTKKNGSGRASHPSLNVYPESNFSLNDCSLVWQEKTTGNSKIYYTKFKYANNNLTQFRPPFYNRNNDTALIFQLSDSFQDSKFPVIYRNLNNLEFGDTTNIQNEIIAWESAQSLKMNISLKSLLYFFYDNGNYSAGYIRPQNNINGCYNCMNHNYFYMPVLSQMSSYSNVMNSEPNLRYNLNFTKKINNDPMTVYHFEPAFYSLIASGNKIENYTFSDFRVADGTYPHLALSPVTNDVNIWKNRRVFEDGVSGNIPVIVPNSKYFYTVGEESCCPKTKFFGHKSGLNIFNISNLSVKPLGQNDYTLSFNLPYQEITDTVNGSFYIPVEQDTLYSDWFQVDSAATLSYLLNFNDSLSVTMRLQKQSTGEFTYLPVPFIPNSEFMNLVYFLVNGDNDYYRLAMLVRDSNAVYHESIVEDYLTQDTVFSKNGSSTSLINLRPERISEVGFYLEIRPNPATDVVNLTTYSESIQKVKYTVYNQQGIGILTLNGRTNQQYQINTKDFTTGIYIVKSEIDSKIIKTSKLVIVK